MASSKKVRRFKRKLKKNLDVIAFSLFLLAGVGFFGNKYLSKRNASQARNMASIKPMTAAEQSHAKAKVQGFLGQVKAALKQDSAGISAFVLFMRQVAPEAVEKDKNLNKLCKNQKTCPLPLKEVYTIGLARLDRANLPTAKEALQASLIQSEIHILEKQRILAQHLIGTQMHKSKKLSQLRKGDNVEISQSAQYLLVTAKQLQMLKMPEKEYLRVMYRALDNSNDKVAKQLIYQGLQKGYPKFKDEIIKAANQSSKKVVR